MYGNIIECCGTVGQFIRDIPFTVIEAVADKNHVKAFFQENGCKSAVSLLLAGHVEASVDIHKHSVIPDRLRGIEDIQHLCRVASFHVGNVYLALIIIGHGILRNLHAGLQNELHHGLGHLDAAAANQHERGGSHCCNINYKSFFHF